MNPQVARVAQLVRLVNPANARVNIEPGKWKAVPGFVKTEPVGDMPLEALPQLAASGDVQVPEGLLQFENKAAPMAMMSNQIPFSLQLMTETQMLASQYIPAQAAEKPAVILVLHGCLQHSQRYALAAGWTELADQRGWILVAPQQTYRRHGMLAFKWFAAGKGQAGWEEAESIMKMVDAVKHEHNIDSAPVYVTGLSAGGAMTAVMMTRYPQRFAGAAVLAGLPYGCAGGEQEATSCMRSGKDLTPPQWATLVRNVAGDATWPQRISLWQGDRDSVVNPMFLNELRDQWTGLIGAKPVPTKEDTICGYPHEMYEGEGGKKVELYRITGMDHATPVDPGNGPDRGGNPDVCGWVCDANIFSSYHIASFWGL